MHTTDRPLCRRDKIAAALDPVEIRVDGAYDDPNGSHITIFCVSEQFEGKRSLARQQMVFKAIWDEMQGARAPPRAASRALRCRRSACCAAATPAPARLKPSWPLRTRARR